MFVIKRDGSREPVQFDKILERIRRLCEEQNLTEIDPAGVAKDVISGVYSGVTTVELDELAAENAGLKTNIHPQFGELAAAIEVSNLHKELPYTFSETIHRLVNYTHPVTKAPAPLISEEVAKIVRENADVFDSAIMPQNDYLFQYFGFKTLKKSYLLKMNGKPAETPQYLFMRVAIGMHKTDLSSALQTYKDMSRKLYIHATPTLYNSGTPTPQMSSCFLMTIAGDSITEIFKTIADCAEISKHAGGIGISVHKIRASGSYICGTNGKSNGLVPMLRVFNNTARYVDQGGGKRKGAFAIYLEPWHADIEAFLDLRLTQGDEHARARDLFYALWVPDLFMERIESDGDWSLFCPNEAPGLADVHSEEFKALYTKYEQTPGLARKTMKARDLWHHAKTVKRETGIPFIMFKDTCNRRSNHRHLGTLRSSNLCTEIVQYTSPDEVAVCNLASMNLTAFVVNDVVNEDGEYILSDYDQPTFFNFTAFIGAVKRVTRNLDRVIDENYYPVPEACTSNMKHRPMGIGVQGLADVFAIMRFPWESAEARVLNKQIFEAMYYAAMTETVELAKERGCYESFKGSPLSQGLFQFDLDRPESKPSPHTEGGFNKWCPVFEWERLRADVVKHGARNSLLIATMPTASTSNIQGNFECTEPPTSNLYARRISAGDYIITNRHMVRDLMKEGKWTPEVRNALVRDNGSLQNIEGIPLRLKKLYKTAWEIPQRVTMDLAIDRGPFICQSQSFNIHKAAPTLNQLDAMVMRAWKGGLKTCVYYLRMKPSADAQKVTVQKDVGVAAETTQTASSLDSGGGGAGEESGTEGECLMCGS